jgi:hypothetical protein
VTADALLKLLQGLRDEFGCTHLSLRCDCENLETVYVEERSGVLIVTDRGDTFQYVDSSGNSAYAATAHTFNSVDAQSPDGDDDRCGTAARLAADRRGVLRTV